MRAKKSLGQNFLTSPKIVKDIVTAAFVGKDDVVLEVGPGKGVLTEALVESAGQVIAIEKDWELVELLKKKFAGQKNLEIIHADILKFNLKDHGLETQKYKIVANIPYYITSHLLRQSLQSDCQPSLMVLMVQKEVAERIACSAERSKESILSISIKAYGEPKIIRPVAAKYFLPVPKVDSAILLIDNISKSFFEYCPASDTEQCEKSFFALLKAGFSHKRKILKNNLCIALSLESDTVLTAFHKCEIEEKSRAEKLPPQAWQCLARTLSPRQE